MHKGTSYENAAANLAEAELNNGNLGIDPSCAIVRRKPKYYSRDRKSEITFDVSIELCRKMTPASSPNPYLIWIWECKNYRHQVPVDDVEEFHSKLNQVGAVRTKGTMITPIGFDNGVLEFARSKGIGLWRWIPAGSIVSLMEDELDPSDSDIERGLTISNTTGFRSFGNLYALTCSGVMSTDLFIVLQNEIVQS